MARPDDVGGTSRGDGVEVRSVRGKSMSRDMAGERGPVTRSKTPTSPFPLGGTTSVTPPAIRSQFDQRGPFAHG